MCLVEEFKIVKLWINLVRGGYRATVVRKSNCEVINIDIPIEVLTSQVKNMLEHSLWNKEYILLKLCTETQFFVRIIKATLIDVLKPIDKF